MNVLALDFDGVICDSADEVLQTALGAWAEVSADSGLSAKLGGRSGMRLAFDQLIPLGNRAEDFGVALHILENNIKVNCQEDYDVIRAGLGPRWLEKYHQAFYCARERLRDDDPGRWLGLHRTYPVFIDILNRRRRDARFSIVTAKDGESVRRLLKHFALDHLFSDDLILDKEVGIAKTAHLRILADRLGSNSSDITFVDDKLNHLLTTASFGGRGVLAGWGHNTPREHQAARQAGFVVASLETAESILFLD
jgi:phosphoglycolate phosphatase-like HAD superfamily hydrolase